MPVSSRICASSTLASGGQGVEFAVLMDDEVAPAFAVRFGGAVYAYVNRCSHMDLKLNFLGPNFFDLEQTHLMCATHGALYAPDSGQCRGGPCGGVGLIPIPVHELDGNVLLSDNKRITLCDEDSK